MRGAIAAAAVAAASLIGGTASASTPAGTALTASATLTYQDARGSTYGEQSNSLSTTVAAVGAVVVGPKETAPDPTSEGFATGATVVRTFTVQNASNVRDAYTVTGVDLTAGTLGSLAFVQNGVETSVAVNNGASPQIAPNDSLALRVTVQTAGVAVGTVVSITVHVRTVAGGTANGLQSDTGRSFAIAASGPALTGVGGPATPIDKTVDGARTVQRAAGAHVHYAIAFANTGGAPAANVVVDDTLPPQIHPNAASVTLNGTAAAASTSGGHLVVTLPALAVGARALVAFDATLDAGTAVGTTVVNTATVRADGLQPISSLPATIFVGTAGIVFDGLNAASAPIGGAIAGLADPRTGAPLALPAAGIAPNANDANPFTVGGDGSYAFVLPPAGSGSTSTLTVTAPPGYQNRRIAIGFVPDATGTLGTLTATALDGQPLATEGGYALVNRPVVLHDVAGVWPNVPLFPVRAFSITLTADRAFASAGDRIVYTATVQSSQPQHDATVRITVALPQGLALAPGTGRFDGARSDPVRSGRAFAWDVAAADAAVHTLRFAAVVLPTAETGRTLTTSAAVQVIASAASLNANASTDVRIVAGVFGDRGIVTGRVYAMASGHRVGVAGVRVYREDGTSVVTDTAGRFSFLGMRPGMHVLRLDPVSLPAGFAAFAQDTDFTDRSTMRLIHGILDSGGLEDVEFEVRSQ
ncbi:MAG TPA: isopeptide-forming domain-containing fimbrial protein [Candidatus Elarobacter sp.]|jgi:uncharacterized repeat protein (TIGR01451 family)|nr:isopeptide-forming domain-containing fimbrial protein [Candidatus Elarobacter sp.]